MDASLRDRVGQALGSSLKAVRGLSGGDINEAYRVELGDGRVVFVKSNANADPEMFVAEAEGLAWLNEPGVLRIPEVLAVAEDFLVLEYLEPARPTVDFDEQLGAGLAALHRASPGSFGHTRDNFIGRLPQSNERVDDWAEFYVEQRLRPQLKRAQRHGLVDTGLTRDFERLFARMPGLVGDPEPPARLHGDLWGGNLHRDERGFPALIDPAVYGGHREIDLAMMRLFGGFSEECFAAYDEAWPLAPGHEDRVDLYQLYPLMVHVNLFGGGYLSSVRRVLRLYA